MTTDKGLLNTNLEKEINIMMKLTKEGIAFKTTWGAQLFKSAIFVGTFVICILLFGIITAS